MRILIESPTCNALEGSNAAVGFGWVSHLARLHEVHVVVYGPHYDRGHQGGVAPPVENLHPIRIPRSRVARLGTLTDYVVQVRRARARLIADVGPDIVHSLEPAGWLGARALATRAVPYVLGPLNGGAVPTPRRFANEVLRALPVKPVQTLTRQGPRKLAVSLLNEGLFGSTPTAKALAHRAMRAARRIVLATGLSADAIPGGVADRVRRVIPQGIDLDLFRPLDEPPTTGPLEVIYTGRITPWKGLHLVIEALAETRARLTVYGSAAGADEWYERYCRERAQPLGERVTFAGAVPRAQLAKAYARADVFCMLSLWEPYATTWIESFACGTPVIGLATGGAREGITPGIGWLIEPTDVRMALSELGTLLDALDTDRDQVRRAGARARAEAEERYSWPRLAAQMDAIYHELV